MGAGCRRLKAEAGSRSLFEGKDKPRVGPLNGGPSPIRLELALEANSGWAGAQRTREFPIR